MTFKELLRKETIKNSKEIMYSEELYEPLYDLIDKSNLKTFTNDENNRKEEEIDFENFSVLELNEDNIVICAGGDWQEPIKFELFLDNDNIKTKILEHNVYDEGIYDEEYLSMLFNDDKKNDFEHWVDYLKDLIK